MATIGTTQKVQLQLKQGVVANLNTTANKLLGIMGEPVYTTDTKQLYIHDGTEYVPIGSNSISGTFTTVDGKTVTVTNGLVTSIV